MKYFFKRILPTPEKLKNRSLLRPVLTRVGHARIWQVNRQSIAVGVAIGLFFSAIPMPVQIICASLLAVIFRANLPTAVFSTLVSNPFTFGPYYYFNYCVGVSLFGGGKLPANLHFDMKTLSELGGQVLLPLYTGSVVVGLVLAALSYVIVRLWWRYSLVRHHYQRRQRNGSKQ